MIALAYFLDRASGCREARHIWSLAVSLNQGHRDMGSKNAKGARVQEREKPQGE